MTRMKPKMSKESLELSSVTLYLVEWAAMLCYTHTASQRALCGSSEILNRVRWLQPPPVSYVVFNRGQKAELHMCWGSILPGSYAHTLFSVCLKIKCRFSDKLCFGVLDHTTVPYYLWREVCGIYSLTLSIKAGTRGAEQTDGVIVLGLVPLPGVLWGRFGVQNSSHFQ